MAKRIPAGEMRHIIEIQCDTGEQDSYGQITHDWNIELKARAKLDTLRGAEGELARQIYPHATTKATIDYTSELNSTGGTQRRICFGDRTLFIGAIINPDEENVQLELLCGEQR